ncbi:amidohydrolase [Alkalihalobacillus pseudalcaliphilus]|uniref:amidohydrolase n=1 Tax=Alkalihalobacillus pseudalcaliphilus TaxID=79884 RepID=UPI00064DD8B5|nr:amidohydrolase [Alkalihalobacillus pseudalcaliphilus]KMK76407.1 N-ethylammeline chlorohydrolase [Alkalihalobacillus pseudalcaliphilus]
MGLVVKNVKIISFETENTFDGYLYIEQGQFKEIKQGNPRIELVKENDVIDGKGKWAIPGFVNTHTHIGMNLLRGYSDELPLQKWLQEKMWPFEAKLDRQAVKAARRLALVEMLKSGTTTFLEMYHLFMDDLATDVESSGMRASLMRSMIGLCSKEEQEAKLQEAVHFAKRWHQQADGRIQTMLAPHAPYTCPPAFIERIIEEAIKLQLPVHTHLAETAKEVNDHIEKYGVHPANHFYDLGFLESVDWLFAHGVFLEEEQLELLSQGKNVAISHNPISNLKLGSGIAQVTKWQKYDLKVCLGTDSVASNNTLDMVEEMRMAALIHKGYQHDPTVVTGIDALKMATLSGSDALQFKTVQGLKPGFDADFLLIDAHQAHLQPNQQILSHLVYALNSQDIRDIFVKGKQLMKNRELSTLDEDKIIADASQEFKRIAAK